jgi:pimeloyl-ACP methyl ester carboxylesterase
VIYLGGGSNHIEVGGLRIAFERVGAGAPLVLLHGALGDSRNWRRQLEELSDEFTIVAWDAPGCGRSSDPPETFRLPDYADCLAAFVDALRLERPHVLGLSFGGGLALELYRRKPALPRTLVLASAYAGWAGSLPPEVVAERLETGLREAELPPERLVPGWLSDLLRDDAPAELAEEIVAVMSEFHSVGLRVMARSFAEADLRDVLPHIKVPTLLLYGDADKRSPLFVGAELHRQIQASTLVVIPGVGHMTNMEAPSQFNTEVRNFLHSHQT